MKYSAVRTFLLDGLLRTSWVMRRYLCLLSTAVGRSRDRYHNHCESFLCRIKISKLQIAVQIPATNFLCFQSVIAIMADSTSTPNDASASTLPITQSSKLYMDTETGEQVSKSEREMSWKRCVYWRADNSPLAVKRRMKQREAAKKKSERVITSVVQAGVQQTPKDDEEELNPNVGSSHTSSFCSLLIVSSNTSRSAPAPSTNFVFRSRRTHILTSLLSIVASPILSHSIRTCKPARHFQMSRFALASVLWQFALPDLRCVFMTASQKEPLFRSSAICGTRLGILTDRNLPSITICSKGEILLAWLVIQAERSQGTVQMESWVCLREKWCFWLHACVRSVPSWFAVLTFHTNAVSATWCALWIHQYWTTIPTPISWSHHER